MREEDYYKYAKSIVRKYFKTYKYLFKNNSIDEEDLIQESAITVWDVLKRYIFKHELELKKLVSGAVGNTINSIRRKCILKAKVNVSTDIDILLYADTKNDFSRNKSKLTFSEIMEQCTQREAMVIYGRFIEKKTYNEIAREIHLSDTGARKILMQGFKKLKKYLK